MRKLVSIVLLLFILASLSESKVVATGVMNRLTDAFNENYKTGKINRDDPEVKKMQESLSSGWFGRSEKITFSNRNFKEDLLNGWSVDLHVVPVEEIMQHCSVDLRNHRRYKYLSSLWDKNENLFNWSNNEDWPYTVDNENYAMELAGTFENQNFLEKKEGLVPKKLKTSYWKCLTTQALRT
jgi:hypothetical protein